MRLIPDDRHAITAELCLQHLTVVSPGWIHYYKAQSIEKPKDWVTLCSDSDFFHNIGIMLVKDKPKRVYQFIYSPHALDDDKLKGPIKPNDQIYFSSRFRIEDDKVVWTDSKVRTYFTCKYLLRSVLDLWDANNFIVISIWGNDEKREFIKHQDDGTDLI